MHFEIKKSTVCESHKYRNPDETLCKGGVHICLWCEEIIDTCDCFEGTKLTALEEETIKKYLFQVAKILDRDLRSTEKQAVIQLFLDLKEEKVPIVNFGEEFES